MQRTGDWSKLARALKALSGFSTQTVGTEIGEALLGSTRRRFKEGKAPDGSSWPKSIRAKETGGQTLVHRRRLERSVTYKVSPGQVDVGTNDKRAAVHQDGRTIRPRQAKALKFRVSKTRWAVVKQVKMPKRPFIGLSAEDEQTIETIIMEEIRRRAR